MRNLILFSIFAMFMCGCFVPVVADDRDVDIQLSDAAIVTKVSASIKADDPKNILNISTYSFNGHVFLVGEANNEQRRAAVAKAQAVAGVKSVKTHWFQPGTSNYAKDSALLTSVDAALLTAKGVSSWSVQAEVWGGNVVLLGMVDTQQEAQAAGAAVHKVQGVRSVTNYILITP